MSRGRGRGRGGGAGRGGGPMGFSGLQSEIQGVSLFPTEPVATFPEITLPIPRKLTTEEEAILQQQDELLETIRQSAFYITVPLPSKDIERYSDKYLTLGNQRAKLRSIQTDLDFFPEELHRVLDPSKKGNTQRKVEMDLAATFERIEQQAKDGDQDDDADEGEREGADRPDDDGEDDGVVDAEYEDEDDDYAQQYFDNGEGDEGGDDDDQDGAVF
ncbi:DNA-directed RNA polymerase III, subunit Rpc31 [Syncephalis fuscata]|nr:DNA-directed RNA polymerase III, subunit Rpc31 [Syncephalis fuscata]